MVFQKYSSYPWLSVIENIEFGLKLLKIAPKERRERALKMLEIVGLTGHEDKYPAELSGGQQQRVAIARSLLCNSEVLLMDEPFGALDISTRLKMQDFLADIWRKALQDMTIIFVTHDIPEAVYLADEIWIMSANPGQIQEKVHIDIPIYRAKEMKRTKQFQDYVYYLEDKLNG
jgi:NitT/TauT family transport system ATP-binding protein